MFAIGGIAAPAGVDPVEHAHALIDQLEQDFNLRFDYVSDLMKDSPCEIEDWDCWRNDDSTWLADTLHDHEHVLSRWYQLPLYGDFEGGPKRWIFGLLATAVEHAARLAAARPNDGTILSHLSFDLVRGISLRQAMRAIRFGATAPTPEQLDLLLLNRLSISHALEAWALSELARLQSAHPFLHWGYVEQLLARENRTLNRARSCLEQVVELAEPDKLAEFILTEAEICGPGWQSWRNWRGDESIDLYIFNLDLAACQVSSMAQRDVLAHASVRARFEHDSEQQRLAAIAASNPFYPDRGAFIRDESVCFESLSAGCGEACVLKPWNSIGRDIHNSP